MAGSADGRAVGIVGAGAMGSGIAQVAAVHGHPVALADPMPQALARARAGHERALAREVEKGRLTSEQAAAAGGRIRYVEAAGPESLGAFATCALVIEAIVEELPAKQALFRTLEGIVAPGLPRQGVSGHRRGTPERQPAPTSAKAPSAHAVCT